jgi:hypothetical protein
MKNTVLILVLFVAVAGTAQTAHNRYINTVKEICSLADTEIEMKSGYVEGQIYFFTKK